MCNSSHGLMTYCIKNPLVLEFLSFFDLEKDITNALKNAVSFPVYKKKKKSPSASFHIIVQSNDGPFRDPAPTEH